MNDVAGDAVGRGAVAVNDRMRHVFFNNFNIFSPSFHFMKNGHVLQHFNNCFNLQQNAHLEFQNSFYAFLFDLILFLNSYIIFQSCLIFVTMFYKAKSFHFQVRKQPHP